MTVFNGKHILLGVTGSIAAFKAADLASKLTQLGAQVDVILDSRRGKIRHAAHIPIRHWPARLHGCRFVGRRSAHSSHWSQSQRRFIGHRALHSQYNFQTCLRCSGKFAHDYCACVQMSNFDRTRDGWWHV